MVQTQIVYAKPPAFPKGDGHVLRSSRGEILTPAALKTYEEDVGSILGCVLRPKSSSR
jgi:hypothetical protein